MYILYLKIFFIKDYNDLSLVVFFEELFVSFPLINFFVLFLPAFKNQLANLKNHCLNFFIYKD